MSTDLITAISLDNGLMAYVQDPQDVVVEKYRTALDLNERTLIEVTDLKGDPGYIDSDAISTIGLKRTTHEVDEGDEFGEGAALVLNLIEDVAEDFGPEVSEPVIKITDALGSILGLNRESELRGETLDDSDCADCNCGFCQEDAAEKSNRQELGDILVDDPSNFDVILVKGAVLDDEAIYATESATWVRVDDKYEATPGDPIRVIDLRNLEAVFDLSGNKLDI